jgi:multiple sugar transport system permease protein
MAALAIFQFRTHWDDLLWPMIALTREKLYTVPVGVALLTARSEPQHAHRNAAAFISIVPMVVVFLLFQRHIVRGIALTGMGGT